MKVIYDDERNTRYYKDEYEMFFENLKDRKLDFNELTKLYLKYLQCLEDIFRKQMCEADYSLIDYIQKGKLSDKNKHIKDCAVKYLVKYERFKGAKIYDELKQYVKDNNLNLKSDYYLNLYLEKGENNE